MNQQFTDVIRKKYYHMGEACLFLNENDSCIRFWMNEFGLNVRRNHRHYRMIDRGVLAILHMIKNLLRTEKYTIEGAKQKLREAKLI